MYLNVFRHVKRPDLDLAAYARDAERMESLASQRQGFIAFRRYTSPDGEALSISEWETETDAQAWARHPEHREVQSRGRKAYYDRYVLYLCCKPEIRRFQRRHDGSIDA